MDKKDLKFIFAPLGVAIGITAFIAISITISKALDMQSISDMLPFVPKFAFILIGAMSILVFLPIFIAGIHCLNRRGAVGQSETLRTNGIYRYTRNPMYAGISMIIIGIGLALLNTGVIIGGLLWLCITFVQCKREEKELQTRFGEEYRIYKLKTPMFIPNISLLASDVFMKNREKP